MRRSALQFGNPIVCALLGVLLVGASGKADDAAAPLALPELAMAVTPAPAALPMPTPLATQPPTTRPAGQSVEMLITSAPIRVEKPVLMMPTPAKPQVVMMEVT